MAFSCSGVGGLLLRAGFARGWLALYWAWYGENMFLVSAPKKPIDGSGI